MWHCCLKFAVMLPEKEIHNQSYCAKVSLPNKCRRGEEPCAIAARQITQLIAVAGSKREVIVPADSVVVIGTEIARAKIKEICG